MAKTNKYTSINFNDIYDKKNNPNSTSSSTPKKHLPPPSSYHSAPPNYQNAPNYKAHLTHGRMLVLTRPTPKHISIPSPQPAQTPARTDPQRDPISLRPLGRTGSSAPPPAPALSPTVQDGLKIGSLVSSVTSPKPDRFVPPHLRPGFLGKEERPEPEAQKQSGFRVKEPFQGHRQQQGYYGSPGRYGEDRRPKSGGYDRMRRGGESDLNRVSSFGTRPSSSGWICFWFINHQNTTDEL